MVIFLRWRRVRIRDPQSHSAESRVDYTTLFVLVPVAYRKSSENGKIGHGNITTFYERTTLRIFYYHVTITSPRAQCVLARRGRQNRFYGAETVRYTQVIIRQV